MRCQSCGEDNPDRAKFCLNCGSPQGLPGVTAAEERKAITALFCDLVGFTAASESTDPEDVDRMLRAYHREARRIVESYGGVVEKFIGDAVFAVFGAPSAHEDDPERAIRAALSIVEAVEELPAAGDARVQVRCGVNTGEAFVHLRVDPGSGEGFVTGDAVNTAARLQSIAPTMGVVAGVSTYEATSFVFDYKELEPVRLKGKADPVKAYLAKAPRVRFGTDLIRTHAAPFVGREIELASLTGTFDRVLASSSVQLVTVVGAPGIGKSRIVAELFSHVDSLPTPITRRRGRCLPYGEGVAFWALGEIVKGHTGILETDPPDIASAKLDPALPEGPEREWFRQRLLPLLGIGATSTAEREELFTAWRRFLESIAEENPTVLVFEDLHWADEAMLSFLEHLATVAKGVPLLVVATARPEFYERRPDYASGLRNANTINLTPLTGEEIARLVSALLEAAATPVELQRPILDRAGGNPLYAEEFVRLLKDKDLLVRKGSSWSLVEGAEAPFPDSVQGLIAARLDTLRPELKAILADAAVVGQVFWAGTVAQIGERSAQEVAEALRDLSRLEFVRPARRSTMEGEAEFSFWHILVRDVAYSQIPRASRADRHVAAASWIEAKAGERVEDLAEVLAHHHSTALELVVAAGDSTTAESLRPAAFHFLSLAGERALGLDTETALSLLERALALVPVGHAGRPEALTRFAEAAFDAGHLTEASAALEQAISSFREGGDVEAAARAMLTLRFVLFHLGDARTKDVVAEALALLEPLPPGPELVRALTEMAATMALRDESEDAIFYADRATSSAAELGLDPPIRALGYRGTARADLGDAEGLGEMREALALAIEAGMGRDVAILYNNLGHALWRFEGPGAAVPIFREGAAFVAARGISEMARYVEAGALDPLLDAGAFDEALSSAARLAEWSEPSGADLGAAVRWAQVRAWTVQGELDQAAAYLDWLVETVRRTGIPERAYFGLAASASARAALGERQAAVALLHEIAGLIESLHLAVLLPSMVRTALSCADQELAERLVADMTPRTPYAEHALVAARAAIAEAARNLESAVERYADAAERWEAFGHVLERAFALLGQGRCLLALSRAGEGAEVLRSAREVFASLGARPAVEEIDDLLAPSTALSS